MVSRRELLRNTVALSALGALAACNAGGVTAANTLGQQVVSDIGLIASGLAGALPGLTGAGLSATAIGTVSGYISQIQGLASGISTALTTTAAQPIVQQITSVLGEIVSIAGPALPPPFGEAIMAAEVLIPVIATAVGIVSTATAAAPAMSPAEARLILASMHR